MDKKQCYDTEHILDELERVSKQGGRAYLPCGEYTVDQTIVVDTPSSRLEGEVWSYSSDPNGVFESDYGTKLRLSDKGYPAISVGVNQIPAGVSVTNLGIYSGIEGMDTRPLLDINNISACSGLHFGGHRVDQGEFSKLSFCGLATAICVTDQAELDACTFERVNTDGCAIGIYFAPRASYYTFFRRCIVADTPSYGFFADGTHANMHDLEINDLSFVRNCGSNPLGTENAAIYLKKINRAILRDNLIDYPGVFWYFEPHATSGKEHQSFVTPAVGLKIEGDKNRVLNNIFTHHSRESIVINGNENILMNNLSDGDVLIEGEGNTVVNQVFTMPEARLILKGAAAEHTLVIGIPEERILRV